MAPQDVLKLTRYCHNSIAQYLAGKLYTAYTGDPTFTAQDIYPYYCAIADHNDHFKPRATLLQAHANGESTRDEYATHSPRYFRHRIGELPGTGLFTWADRPGDTTYGLAVEYGDVEQLLQILDEYTDMTFPPDLLSRPPDKADRWDTCPDQSQA